MKSRILVPTDYSPGSIAALERAVQLADRLDAELDLLHVEDVPGGNAKAQLRHFASLVERKDGRPIHLRVESGEAAPCIVRVADEGGYTMVVIATHGRRGIEHAILGSVAEEVVRDCAVPVLTVRLSAPLAARRSRRAG